MSHQGSILLTLSYSLYSIYLLIVMMMMMIDNTKR